MLEQACKSLALSSRAKPRQTACTMSVNVSAVQLRSRDFTRTLEKLISATSIEPKLLCLEITESVLMGDVDYFSKVLHELRAIGTRLSIDDFGTGYSSLAYLRRFPVDELKIDRSFIANLDSDPYDATLVAAVIAIGEALGLRVVAEGVETAEELAVLRDLGCQYARGLLVRATVRPRRVHGVSQGRAPLRVGDTGSAPERTSLGVPERTPHCQLATVKPRNRSHLAARCRRGAAGWRRSADRTIGSAWISVLHPSSFPSRKLSPRIERILLLSSQFGVVAVAGCRY